MSQKYSQNKYHVNENINLMIENVTRINNGIIIYAHVSAKIQKNIMHVKKIIFGILDVVVKMINT